MREDLDHAARPAGGRINGADQERSGGGDPAGGGRERLLPGGDSPGRLDDERSLVPGPHRHLQAGNDLSKLRDADSVVAGAGVCNPARRVELDPPKRGHCGGYRKSHRAIRLLGHRRPFRSDDH